MEKDTVILSIERYEELKKAESELEGVKVGDSCILEVYSWKYGGETEKLKKYISTSKAIKEILEINKNLKEDIEKLLEEKDNFANAINKVTTKHNSLFEEKHKISKMSIFQFLRWKKSYKKTKNSKLQKHNFNT